MQLCSAVKYNIDVTEDMVDLLNHLDDDWKKFLKLLEESEKQLRRDKVCNIIVWLICFDFVKT